MAKRAKRGLAIPGFPGRRIVAVPAPIGKRIFAFLIDIIILNIFLVAPFRNILRNLIPPEMSYSAISAVLETDKSLSAAVLLIAFASGFISLLYFAILEYRLGFTIGKLFLGIRVVADEVDGKVDNKNLIALPTFWRCFARSLFIIPVFPFIIFWVLDPVYLMMAPAHQRLLERWTRTRTIGFVAV